MDLFSELQTLLPLAIKWAKEHSEKIQDEGVALTPEQIKISEKVGVTRPEKLNHYRLMPVGLFSWASIY